MGVLGLESLTASAVAGWIARLKRDLGRIDEGFSGVGGVANYLANPGFEIHQRGAPSYTGDGVFTLDAWQISYAGGVTLTVTAETGVVDAGSAQSAKCVFAAGGGVRATLEQLVEEWAVLKGRTVTFSLRVKCSVANAARAAINDGGGITFGAYHSGGGGWETLVVTHTLDPAAATFKVALALTADCTAYADNAVLVFGSTAMPFLPLSPEVDRLRAHRRYEQHGGTTQGAYPRFKGYAAAPGDVLYFSIGWRAPKAALITPTLTVGGTWIKSNVAAGPTAVAATTHGCVVALTATAAGYVEAYPDTGAVSPGTVVGEANPT